MFTKKKDRLAERTMGGIVWVSYKRIAYISSTLATAMGGAFLFGGPKRINAEAYKLISESGGAYIWGCGFLAIGILLYFSKNFTRNFLRYSLLVAASAYFALCISFSVAAILYPAANVTAPVVYFFISLLHTSCSEVVREGITWIPPAGPPCSED